MQDPHVLQVVVVVGCAVIGFTWLAGRLRITPPIVLLLGGVPLAFIPWTSDVVLEPTVVLLVFLPALLYWESLTTSLREIRSNLRVVVLSSVLLVLATAGLVAVTAHALLGLSWPLAWVLGAVVAPTDATAMAAVAGRMPRRTLTTLRAESLINDGTALVVFALAVSVATGEQVFSWASAIGAFALSYVGGALAGLVVAWLAVRARKLVHAPLSEAAISLLTPFVAFLLAEELHASGVLAVVVCGLTLSQSGPRVIGARTRIQTEAFWRVTTFVLNGTLFVLVGLQLRGAVEGLSSTSVPGAAAQALLVAAVVIGTRLLWMNVTPYVIRAIDRRPQQRLRRVGFRQRQPMAWAGFRGGVSLAAALAVPQDVPGRDLIVLVTFGVILVTLVVQGLTLPAVLRWARLTDDGSEAREHALAERAATEAGLSALPAVAERLGVGPLVVERVRADYEEHLHVLADPTMPVEDPALAAERGQHADDQRLRAALIAEKRAAVVGLRDSRKIDDIVLRRLQSRLDAEEVRLSAPSADLE
ncbi:Na+/H+ antiporter [Pseudonocardia xinjiangensis]|uniref:Na+/H+ antiporter n=1 Tax=Pseudonocardia xinjiangensis TaxID=75289 RepID=UPI003D8EB146